MTATVILDVDGLAAMSQAQRDEVFRTSPAGSEPRGRGRGTVLVGSGGPLPRAAAALIRLVAWQGKVFAADGRELGNLISPFGILAVKAEVYRDASWFDAAECIVLDYSRTSVVAGWIRDEIREVAPGIYLGIVYGHRVKLINFVLDFQPGRPV